MAVKIPDGVFDGPRAVPKHDLIRYIAFYRTMLKSIAEESRSPAKPELRRLEMIEKLAKAALEYE